MIMKGNESFSLLLLVLIVSPPYPPREPTETRQERDTSDVNRVSVTIPAFTPPTFLSLAF